MARSPQELTLAVYEQLLVINSGFDQVRRALGALQRNRIFDSSELERCGELAAESKAVINSYLVHVIETAEVDEAGRLFRRRVSRERKEDSGE